MAEPYKNQMSAPKEAIFNSFGQKMISFKDLPEFETASDRSAKSLDIFIRPLTAKGKTHALATVNLAKGGNKDSICLLCLEEGNMECLFNFKGKGGNKSTHFNNLHVLKGVKYKREVGHTFTRIVELEGETFGKMMREQFIDTHDGYESKPCALNQDDLVTAIGHWVCDTGQPLDVTERDSFREVVRTAMRLCNDKDALIGAFAVRHKILDLAEDYRSFIASLIKELPDHSVFVAFDGWDGVGKIIGITISFTAVIDTTLEYFSVPIGFKEGDYNEDTGTEMGAPEIREYLVESLQEFSSRGIDLIAGVKADNAMRKAIAELNEPGLEYYTSKSHLFHDIDSDWFNGCLSHEVDLVAAYGTGKKTGKTQGKHNGIPLGPSREVTNVIGEARQLMKWLASDKNYKIAKQVAQANFEKMYKSILSNDTRWSSEFSMLFRCLQLRGLMKNIPHVPLVHNDQKILLLCEILAIVTPIDLILQKISQTTSKPFGFATLPLVYFTLIYYGFEMPNGLFYLSEISIPSDEVLKEKVNLYPLNFTNRISKVVLQYPLLDSPEKKVAKKLGEFSAAGFEFFRCFLNHIKYRLVTQRGNRYYFEICSLFLDPMMKKYAKVICGIGNGQFNYSKLMAEVRSFLSRTETPPNTPEKTQQIASAEKVPNYDEYGPVPDIQEEEEHSEEKDELEIFTKQDFFRGTDAPTSVPEIYKTKAAYTLFGFLEIFEWYNSLLFWSDRVHQKTFPNIFRRNKVLLAYLSSDAVSECLFSTANNTLGTKRWNLRHSPKLMQSIVTLRHYKQRLVAKRKREKRIKKQESKAIKKQNLGATEIDKTEES